MWGKETVPEGGAGWFLINQRRWGSAKRTGSRSEWELESMINKSARGGAGLQSQKPERKLRQKDVLNASLGYTMNLRS